MLSAGFRTALLCGVFLSPLATAQDTNLKAQLEKTRARAETLKTELTAAKKKRAELQKQATALAESITKTEAALAPLAAKESKLAAQVQSIEKRAMQLKVIAASAKKRHDQHNELVSRLNATLTELESKLAAAQRDNGKAKKQIVDLTAALKPKQDALTKAIAAHKAAAAKVAIVQKTQDVVAARLAEAQQAVKTAEAEKKQAANSVAETNKGIAGAAKVIEGLVASAKANPKDAQAQQVATASSATLKQLQDAAGKLKLIETEAEKRLGAARAAVKPIEADLVAKQAATRAESDKYLKPAIAALDKAKAAMKAEEATINKAKAASAIETQRQQIFQSQINAIKPSVRKAKLELENLQREWVKHQKQANTELGRVGRFTSFANQVAPILSKRCLACHNTRDAKGKLNLDSFAAVMKGGESGTAIHPGDSKKSYLFEVIADGSMPQDADPLTNSEQQIIKNWIDNGAPLDAGILASSRLVEIAPKAAQPEPPSSYAAAVPVTALAFNASGDVLATSGYHEVILWNAKDGAQLRRITNVAERVHSLDFSPDGSLLAVAAGTPAQIGELKLFETASGKLIADLVRTDDSVFSAAFSPDGRRIACAGADHKLRVFGVTNHRRLLEIDEHADWVMGVAWSPDGRRLASASRDKTGKLFDANTGEPLWTFNGHGKAVYAIGFSGNGQQVVTASGDHEVRSWNPDTGKQIRRITRFGDEVFSLRVTPAGDVFSVSADRTARRHKLSNGKELKRYAGHSDWVYSVAIHEKSDRLATGSFDGEVRIWSASDGSLKHRFIARPTPQATTASN